MGNLLRVLIAVPAVFIATVPLGAQTSSDAHVTFSKDVAPILQRSCQGCHRTGSMAPMSLVSYQEVRPWARAIKEKVASRVMPPWHLDPTVGIQEFANDISLSDDEISTVVRWVDAGAPQGNPADLPATVNWPTDDIWRLSDKYQELGDPDLVIRSTPWTQAAEGQDQWYQPVVGTGLTTDRWVEALEVRPSLEGRPVVHHAVIYLMQDEKPEDRVSAVEVPGSGSYLTEFAVGKIGDLFRENTGKLLKADSQIRFDIHYHSVGEEITDSTELGIWLYPEGYTPKYRVYAQAMGVRQAMETLDIPPNQLTEHEAFVPLPYPARLENFQPHMHMRGKAMSMEAVLPSGQTRMLNYVDRFDFNWHVNYVYTEDSAPVLPAGTVIKITAWHDNTSASRGNPDPTQWVGWGQRSYDEMYHAHVNIVYLTDEDYEEIVETRSANNN
jgi:hypothetical protein